MMDHFSHDLTLALEETSRCGGARVGRWGRRRTRSTGNLPCAPQPTEDSSSSPAEPPPMTNAPLDACNLPDGHSIQSDSDDRHQIKLATSARQNAMCGNFESDSLNENFSPARPNTRRKRKFKRMAVEYETTPSTENHPGTSPLFPAAGAVKKRVLKHTSQENFRANLFFCGKRKRSHRDRYLDHEHRHHSSSVPRQRDIFAPKNAGSYAEYKNRARTFAKPCERILPLHKSIISKIERISQESRVGFPFMANARIPHHPVVEPEPEVVAPSVGAPKSGSFESTFNFAEFTAIAKGPSPGVPVPVSCSAEKRAKEMRKRMSRRHEMKMQLQFDDPASSYMDCGQLNEFLSSSSLSSSSDSEAGETNESDREGDDELTDWPGNEAMANFTSKNDFKRAKPRPLVGKSMSSAPLTFAKTSCVVEEITGQDDDTLMSGDEVIGRVPAAVSLPIDIAAASAVIGHIAPHIESEMSGETSNHFLESPTDSMTENRELRGGARRIREERPSFSIITSVNEDLSRFLQDGRQSELKVNVPDADLIEHDKLAHLAKMYSLQMDVSNEGCAVLTKTCNTTQSVKVAAAAGDQTAMGMRFMGDYKRRCYGEDGECNDLESPERTTT